MADLPDSSAVLYIYISVTGGKKGHDLMNQNRPSFSCLLIITYEISFGYSDRCYFNKCLEYTVDANQSPNNMKIGRASCCSETD